VEKAHSAVQTGLTNAVLHSFHAGSLLLQAKQRVGHNEWLRWLELSFGAGGSSVSVRMCQRYMQVALRLEALPEFSIQEAMHDPATRASQLRRLEALNIHSIRQVLKLHSLDPIATPDERNAVAPASGNVGQKPQTHRKRLKPCTPLGSDAPPAAPEAGPSVRSLNHSQSWKSSIQDEILTPNRILAPVLECFAQQIDLDPCAESELTFRLPARQSLSVADNGLADDTPWNGNIFVHPPRSDLYRWVNKAVAEFHSGHAQAVALLLPSFTDADFNAPIQPYPRAYLRDRLEFSTPSGSTHRADVAYMLVYVGPEAQFETFSYAVGGYGDVYFAFRFV
jgi:hypothetical protein